MFTPITSLRDLPSWFLRVLCTSLWLTWKELTRSQAKFRNGWGLRDSNKGIELFRKHFPLSHSSIHSDSNCGFSTMMFLIISLVWGPSFWLEHGKITWPRISGHCLSIYSMVSLSSRKIFLVSKALSSFRDANRINCHGCISGNSWESILQNFLIIKQFYEFFESRWSSLARDFWRKYSTCYVFSTQTFPPL